MTGWPICHDAGQTRSTALMLKYGTDDWNALHQDLYGDLVFPLQVVINLSDPTTDYTGGEFLLVEQRFRAQSRGTATQLPQRTWLRLHHPRSAGALGPGLVGCTGAPRYFDRPIRRALCHGPDLSRCGVKDSAA